MRLDEEVFKREQAEKDLEKCRNQINQSTIMNNKEIDSLKKAMIDLQNQNLENISVIDDRNR